MNTPNDTALTGAVRVLGLWIVLGALIGAIWSMRLHSTVNSWFLVCVFLGASGALSPIYGGFIYFSARRREQKRTARGAGARHAQRSTTFTRPHSWYAACLAEDE